MTGAAPSGYTPGRGGHSSIHVHQTTLSGDILDALASTLERDACPCPRTQRQFPPTNAATFVHAPMDEANATPIDSQPWELQFG